MIKIDSKKIQAICTDILKEFDKICKENNLKYSIAAGTMLGAIRHQGFIPWDDDVDVMMPREDYEKLLSLKINNERFEIKDYKNTPGYYYTFAKMIDKTTHLKEEYRCEENMGVFIDIFPLDYFDKIEKRNFFIPKVYKKIYEIIGSDDNYIKDGKKVRHAIKIMAKKILLIIKNPLLKKSEKLSKKPSGQYCVQIAFCENGYKSAFPKEFLNEIVDVKFENISVKCIKKYDIYLKKMYGEDYMQLPPEEQRVAHHQLEVYRREN